MKVLFLSPNLGREGGGAERQIVTVGCLLKDAGFDVEYLYYADGDFYAPILEEKQIPIKCKLLPNYLKRMFYVRKFIRKGNYDAVISFLETPNFLNNFAAVGGKSWKVITGERSAQKRTFLSRKGKIFCWFQRYADYIVCNSDNAKKLWITYYPQYENKLVTIYNNVTLRSVSSSYIPKRDGRVHIVVAASYQNVKNAIGLVNALALLNEQERGKIHVDWYGKKVIAATGTKEYDDACNAIEKNGLQDVITLHEGTTEIHDRMNEADAVGLFSKYEGLPNAICEGMMLGKPIVMTRVSDYATLVDDSNGFLCDWDSSETIKNALLRLINLRKDELLEKGKNSKTRAERLFSKERIIKQWTDFIKK